MKLYEPTTNKLNRGFTSTHSGYDYDDLPDNRVFCNINDAVVVGCFDGETRNWLANTPSDPWYVKGVTRPLKTADYGNYVKLKGTSLDGLVCYVLFAHLKWGSQKYRLGDKVMLGAEIGRMDTTGNSTGKHLHFEVRNSQNKVISSQFLNMGSGIIEETPIAPQMTEQEQKFLQLLTEAGINDEPKIRDALARYKEFPRLETDKKNLDDQYKKLLEAHDKMKADDKIELDKLTTENQHRKEEMEDFIRTLAKTLGTTQDRAVIISEVVSLIGSEERVKELQKALKEKESNQPISGPNWVDSILLIIKELWNKDKQKR